MSISLDTSYEPKHIVAVRVLVNKRCVRRTFVGLFVYITQRDRSHREMKKIINLKASRFNSRNVVYIEHTSTLEIDKVKHDSIVVNQ
jgi:hypothetical protein